MPIYVCYRGDCDHLAHQVPGRSPFVTKDALGRDWLCVETTWTSIPPDFATNNFIETIQAQVGANRQGLSREGTDTSWFDCADETSLRRQLILSTYPDASNSSWRLMQAGWMSLKSTWVDGGPWKLTVSNGRHELSTEGETQNEAWFRMVQKVLGIAPGIQEKTIMPLTIHPDPVPLHTDEHGAIRVGSSQVVLDVVIRAFHNGADPESIVHGFPTLALADVYAVIGYYLRHRREIDEYLQARWEDAQKLRQEIEAKQMDRAEVRAKLLARRAQMELEHASPGE
jgi:uncharacterized protein (DUF433 family)